MPLKSALSKLVWVLPSITCKMLTRMAWRHQVIDSQENQWVAEKEKKNQCLKILGVFSSHLHSFLFFKKKIIYLTYDFTIWKGRKVTSCKVSNKQCFRETYKQYFNGDLISNFPFLIKKIPGLCSTNTQCPITNKKKLTKQLLMMANVVKIQLYTKWLAVGNMKEHKPRPEILSRRHWLILHHTKITFKFIVSISDIGKSNMWPINSGHSLLHWLQTREQIVSSSIIL